MDLIGKVINNYLVVRLFSGGHDRKWLLMCLGCGKRRVLTTTQINKQKFDSCFCSRVPVGQRFNRLTVLSLDLRTDKYGQYFWSCLCDCGRVVSIRQSHIVKGVSKSCGCLNIEVATARLANYQPKGHKHPRWRHDVDDTYRESRRMYSMYYKWRLEVFSRDKYTCQTCGDSRGGNLNAHHIMSYNKFSDFRLLPINGITLCEVCHKDFHSKYGNGNNTLIQFIQWQEERKFNV